MFCICTRRVWNELAGEERLAEGRFEQHLVLHALIRREHVPAEFFGKGVHGAAALLLFPLVDRRAGAGSTLLNLTVEYPSSLLFENSLTYFGVCSFQADVFVLK